YPLGRRTGTAERDRRAGIARLARQLSSGKRYCSKRLRSSSLLTLPVAVCGRASTKATSFGIHHLATWPSKPASSSAARLSPHCSLTTTSSGRSCHLGWGKPITAHSCTAGCDIATFSRSMELIHSPPDLITSLVRSVILI